VHDRHRDVALFRYSVIREAADASLTKAERGEMVRALARRDHLRPGGTRVILSRNTLDRWIRAWRAGGFEALAPSPRAAEPKTPTGMLELAVRLKREVPGRTAAQVAEIMATSEEWSPSARTIQRHFARLGLNTRPDGSPPVAFGRFEAEAPNDRWTGDALHGPVVEAHKA
jgi:putative transposase